MKFSAYIADWLYGEDGYYTKHKTIGKEGDFYTAVSTSMFFGGSIAKRLLFSIEEGFLSSTCSVIEVGAHKGYLLADMVQFIYTLKPELLETLSFVIIEPFEENRMAQKEYFHNAFGNAINLLHVKHLSEFICTDAFFVANEIFDAFPCEVIKENQMLVVKNDKVFFADIEESTKVLAEKYHITKGEVAIGYEQFAHDMAKSCSTFEFVTFDYGDMNARNDFSLRVYAEHQVYPFFTLTDLVDETLQEENQIKNFFGQSDITYDVNFAHLIGAFEENGVMLQHFASQMSALVGFGLIELLDMLYKNSPKEYYEKEANRAKTLIDPSFMGERFKMACFRKEGK